MGQDAIVDPDSKAKLLKAMGYAVDEEAKLAEQVEDERRDYWLNYIDPVKIIRTDESIEIEIRVPISAANSIFKVQVTTEQGVQSNLDVKPIDGAMLDVEVIDELEFQEYLVTIPGEFPCGYHSLTLLDENGEFITEQSLIVAPKQCYQPDDIKSGRKVWGTSVQLYCLRTEKNWGMGDFTDLEYLIEKIAENGGDFVGLNPIHALYPSNADACSPYSPSSRRWLNLLYIDVTKVYGFAAEQSAQAIVQSEEHQNLKAHARNTDHVDYNAIAKLKLPVLKALFAHFENNASDEMKKEFDDFIRKGGDSLRQQSIFDAVQDSLQQQGILAWGWPSWPENLSEYHKPDVAKFAQENKSLVDFYAWCQWIAFAQLDACQAKAKELGMTLGIYRDLAVGVSSGSAEVWANRDLYCADVSVGAPPDPLGPQGQSWGLPPMEPNRLYSQKYQPIIDMYRSNMQSCGALRIDHVMALLRLWWVPGGEHATKGAYVYYPIDDLLALLCLESQRNQCMIIGEDLGTVPEGIREIFAENCVLSYRVFFFETAPDGGFYSPSHYPRQAMATLTTHDMATLKGFWHCDDLKLGHTLGIYPDENELEGLFHARHVAKQRILDSLHGHESVSSNISRDAHQVGMSRELNHSMQIHMAKANSALLSLQLEDWLEMDMPVNVPGTCDEYPNWRRKLSTNLEELFAQDEISTLTLGLNQARSLNM
nr:4-alpha-glucanotransferase [Catenovulum sediminis]